MKGGKLKTTSVPGIDSSGSKKSNGPRIYSTCTTKPEGPTLGPL